MLYNAGVMSQSKKSSLPLQKENMDLILLPSLFSSNTALQNIQIIKTAIRDRFIYSEIVFFFLSNVILVERVQIITKVTKRYKKGSPSIYLGGFFYNFSKSCQCWNLI